MANPNMQLTAGAINKIYNNISTTNPTIQVVDVKKIVTSNNGERYRLVLSDGVNYIQGMLATQIASLVQNNQLQKNSVVRLEEFVCNSINGRRICIVIRCSVLAHANSGIGNPSNIQPGSGNSPNRQRQQDPPPPPQQTFNQMQNQQRNQFNNNNNNQMMQQQQQQQQQQRRYNNNNNNNIGNDDNFQPVSSLNPYQNNWRIKVRVTGKDPIRKYSNAKGEGKVFSVDLLDKDGGEIRATMFNEAVDKFFPILNKDSVYLISRGRVTVARKQYTHIKNDYAITLNENSDITPIDDTNDIKSQQYRFNRIKDITNMPAGTYVDLCAVVQNISELSSIMSTKTQRELTRRSIILCDQSNTSIEMTLWDSLAKEFDEKKLAGNPTVAIKGARISDFNGKSLSCNGAIEIHPTVGEAANLLNWWQSGGANADLQSLTGQGAIGNNANTPRLTISEVKELRLGLPRENANTIMNNNQDDKKNDSRDYFMCTATITSILHGQDRPPWYKACPDPESNAKVSEDGRGQWYCTKNNKTYSDYEPRYILRFCVNDFSGQLWLSAFNDVAKVILNDMECKTVESYHKNGEFDKYEKVFSDACFKKYLFKVRAKSDTYQDETRVRYDCLSVTPVVNTVESRRLIEQIQKIQQLTRNANMQTM